MTLVEAKQNSVQLPAEFFSHSFTIALFPFRPDIWRENAKYAQRLMLSVIDIISQREKVLLCINRPLSSVTLPPFNANIILVEICYDDIWARDISPFFVNMNNKLHGVNFGFNAWGGLEQGSYYPWDNDASFSNALCDFLKINSTKIALILEGGAIANNGAGVIVTTESVLLNPNRNPHSSRGDFEIIFQEHFGIQKVIWLKRGLYYDETDGHIDVFLNFVDEHNVLLAWTDDANNPQYSVLNQAYATLMAETALDGKPFVIHKLPMPEPMSITEVEASGIVQHDGAIRRVANTMLYPTYNNAYIFNGGVLVPVFDSPMDKQAIDIYRKLFSDRIIYPIYSKEFLIGGGNFHCIFHEIPEVKQDD